VQTLLGLFMSVPYWVQKENEALMQASHESEVSNYLKRIKTLEEENGNLKKELADLKRQNEELRLKIEQKTLTQ